MYHYIKGKFTMTFEGGIVIEAGGIGYEVRVPDNCPALVLPQNEEAMLYTKVIYREDDASIYGFADRTSLEVFCRLLTVNGVGARAAMSILSALTLEELCRAVAFEDPDMLTKAPGIGKKTAQRILLELRDKLPAHIAPPKELRSAADSHDREEAIIGLVSLGYSRSEAVEAVGAVETDQKTTENYMKLALRSLMRR